MPPDQGVAEGFAPAGRRAWPTMSLVVGEVHDGRISLISDTKITYEDDPSRTTREIYIGVPKLAILRDDLCVGYAGNDGVGTLEFLIAHRNSSVEGLTDLLTRRPHASHLIASLDGHKLITIRRGKLEPRPSVPRSWVGDPDGFNVFQEQAAKWPPGMDVGFVLLSSMQFLTHFKVVDTIGGYHTRVVTTTDGFRYVADQDNIGPERLEATTVERTRTGLQVRLQPPPGGDTGWMSIQCAVGVQPTPGGLAYLVTQAGHGVIYPHDTPWLPQTVRAEDLAELMEVAMNKFGQHLAA